MASLYAHFLTLSSSAATGHAEIPIPKFGLPHAVILKRGGVRVFPIFVLVTSNERASAETRSQRWWAMELS